MEFRGRITQSGPTGDMFTSNGFLIDVAGLEREDLFAGDPPAVGTALFTAAPTGSSPRASSTSPSTPSTSWGELSVFQPVRPGSRFHGPRLLHQRGARGPVRR